MQRLIFKQEILNADKESLLNFEKNTIFYQSALLYFPAAAFQSRKLLSFGLHIECFCALEIEKKSARMTTTTSIFITA